MVLNFMEACKSQPASQPASTNYIKNINFTQYNINYIKNINFTPRNDYVQSYMKYMSLATLPISEFVAKMAKRRNSPMDQRPERFRGTL